MSIQEYDTTAEIKGGRLRIRNRRAFDLALRSFKDGEVAVRVEKRRATRSQRQNAYWWGVCVQLVSDHTGYSPEEVHELAKQMFIPKKVAIADGNGEVKGEFVIGGTTTKLDKVAFSEFVERFKQWAAETLDVYIPDAREA